MSSHPQPGRVISCQSRCEARIPTVMAPSRFCHPRLSASSNAGRLAEYLAVHPSCGHRYYLLHPRCSEAQMLDKAHETQQTCVSVCHPRRVLPCLRFCPFPGVSPSRRITFCSSISLSTCGSPPSRLGTTHPSLQLPQFIIPTLPNNTRYISYRPRLQPTKTAQTPFPTFHTTTTTTTTTITAPQPPATNG